MPLLRWTDPEDRIRDAFCYAVLLQLKKRHKYTSIDGDWFLTKMRVFYSILEFECKEVRDLFRGMDHLKTSALESLSRARIEKEMFSKSGTANRYYFEWSFDKFAEGEIKNNLSANFQSALDRVMDDAILICLSTKDWEEAEKQLDLYRKTKGSNRGH